MGKLSARSLCPDRLAAHDGPGRGQHEAGQVAPGNPHLCERSSAPGCSCLTDSAVLLFAEEGDAQHPASSQVEVENESRPPRPAAYWSAEPPPDAGAAGCPGPSALQGLSWAVGGHGFPNSGDKPLRRPHSGSSLPRAPVPPQSGQRECPALGF